MTGADSRDLVACILVVDNEAAIRLLVKTILEAHGFVVLLAQDGPSALNLLQDHGVDVLLTDLTMPGMSGQEFISKARERCPYLPVCIMTGNSVDPNFLPEVSVLPKPFHARDLIQTLQQILAPPAVRLDQLRQEVDAARTHWVTQKAKLDEVVAEGPHAIPQPDGQLRRVLTGRAVLFAHHQYMDAQRRYISALARSWSSPGWRQT